MDYFEDYNEWREAITIRCGISHTADYCRERIDALRHAGGESTRAAPLTFSKNTAPKGSS